MPSNKKLLQAAAGSAGGDNLYVEDVFSTYLYDGTGAAHTITNGIDLDGEGGLTWIKTRNTGTSAWHSLSDTERGAGYILRSDLTNAQNFDTAEFTSFNSDGFTVGNDAQTNGSGRTYASWTFRKAEKFFDVVTWVGSNDSGTDIGKGIVAHNLGVAPAVVIVKNATQASTNWIVYHKNQTTGYYSILNSTAAQTNSGAVSYFSKYDGGWSQTNPDADNIYIGYNYQTNGNTDTMVAYLFASDAGGFGEDGDENIIKCGEFSVDGSFEADVDCGFEPQWVLIKPAENTASWNIYDTMRGAPVGGDAAWLAPDLSQQEAFTANRFNPTATGFHIGNYGITAGNKIIYIAIRRPMKTPESGTEVFNPTTAAVTTDITNNFAADLWFGNNTSGNGGNNAHTFASRLTGLKWLQTATTSAEFTASNTFYWDSNTEFTNSQFGGDRVEYFLKRATGFFDVVAYKGNGTAGTAQAHNLGVVPEMMIGKNRSNSSNWMVYHTGATYTAGAGLKLNTTAAGVSNTYDFGNASGGAQRPDASSVYLGGNVNSTNDNYILYLFATLAGVSKVGSYTGTGADLNVDCGFSAGARFILIKRTDSTGDWYFWDSARGITAGNDPYLLLNTTAAEVTNTDYIDPLNAGFTVTSSASSTVNVSSGSYIFLAIA